MIIMMVLLGCVPFFDYSEVDCAPAERGDPYYARLLRNSLVLRL